MTDSLARPQGRRTAVWLIVFDKSRAVTGVGVLSSLLLAVAAALGSGSRDDTCAWERQRPAEDRPTPHQEGLDMGKSGHWAREGSGRGAFFSISRPPL